MSNLKDAFYSQKLNEEQIEVCNKIRDAYFNLATLLDKHLMSSRETSLAMTKLEESSMWAIKSVSLGCYYEVDDNLPGQLKLDFDEEEIPEGMPMGEPYNDYEPRLSEKDLCSHY